jgi:TolB-like protein
VKTIVPLLLFLLPAAALAEDAESPPPADAVTDIRDEPTSPPEEAEPEEPAKEESTTAAGLAAATDRMRVMVPDFKSPDGTVNAGQIEALTGLAVFQLSKVKRFSVISGAEIAEMLRVEAEKQVLGCDEDASCLSEIADAMDARLLVVGTVARIGPRVLVNLSLIDSGKVEVIGRSSIDVRDRGDVPYELKRAVHELASEYGGIPGYSAPKKDPTSVARIVSDIANHPDSAMLFCTVGIGMCSFILPCIPLVPLFQGLTMWLAGKEIAGREYPAWWVGIAAGYATLIVGVALGAGIATGGFFAGNPLLASSTAFGGAALIFLSIFIFEPLAAWGSGLLFAHDVGLEPDESVTTPEDAASIWPMAPNPRWAELSGRGE